jgi:RND family efflux transporter MFP subunit
MHAIGRAARLLLPLLCASVVASGCGFRVLPALGVVAHPASNLPLPRTQQVTTVAVAQGNVTATQQIAGQVQPIRTALLYFTTGGIVQTLNMTNGQSVTAGEVLATLNTGNLAFQISQAGLTIQRDQLQILNVENSLQTSPPTSPQAAQNLMVQIKDAQLQLQADQLSQQKLKLDLAKDEIVAPFSGVIQNVKIQTGQGVGPYQVLAELEDTSAGVFVAKLTAAQATEVSPGQPVKLSLSTAPQSALYTTIATVQIPSSDAVAIAQQNSGLGGLSNPQATLAIPTGYKFSPKDIGAAFNGVVTVAAANNVLYLPSADILQLNGLDYVFLYDKGRTIERPVSLGLEGGGNTVITGGLKAGDTVVSQGG